MQNYSANDVVLIRYPFTGSLEAKLRPAIVINAPHISKDIIIVPLTSKTGDLLPGEFVMKEWKSALLLNQSDFHLFYVYLSLNRI